MRGRAKTVLLFETPEAVRAADEILRLEGIDECYIGLNDLHLGYHQKFLFQPLADGTVEMLCRRFQAAGKPYGFGGVARVGVGALPAERILAEHVRLGSSTVILFPQLLQCPAGWGLRADGGDFSKGNSQAPPGRGDIPAGQRRKPGREPAAGPADCCTDRREYQMKAIVTGAVNATGKSSARSGPWAWKSRCTPMSGKRWSIRSSMRRSFVTVFFCTTTYPGLPAYIQLTSAGYDRVPMEYARDHHVTVRNAAGCYSVPMAEWTVMRILELYKHANQLYENQAARLWRKDRFWQELAGKTACMIGYGAYATETAKRLKAFDVRILAVCRRKKESIWVDAFYFPDRLEACLAQSDIVILATAMTDETWHLIKDAAKRHEAGGDFD